MSGNGAKKYDVSKKEEAALYEMEIREEKMRIIQEHEIRREKYLAYVAEKNEERKLRWWQKIFLGSIIFCFTLCSIMLVCTFLPVGKGWVHSLLGAILSIKM